MSCVLALPNDLIGRMSYVLYTRHHELRATTPIVMFCKPGAHELRATTPIVMFCKPGAHELRATTPIVMFCKPGAHELHATTPIVLDRKSTRLNSSHSAKSRMPSSA